MNIGDKFYVVTLEMDGWELQTWSLEDWAYKQMLHRDGSVQTHQTIVWGTQDGKDGEYTFRSFSIDRYMCTGVYLSKQKAIDAFRYKINCEIKLIEVNILSYQELLDKHKAALAKSL